MTAYTVILLWMMHGQAAGETRICMRGEDTPAGMRKLSLPTNEHRVFLPSGARLEAVKVVDDRCVWMPSDSPRTIVNGSEG